MKTLKSMTLQILAAGLFAGVAHADASPGRAQFDRFIAAFNAGDWDSIAAYASAHASKDMVESGFIRATLEIREELGELLVVDVDEASPYKLTGHVRERESGKKHEVFLLVSSEAPHRIQSILITDPPAAADPAK
jgi:hypothetical protein